MRRFAPPLLALWFAGCADRPLDLPESTAPDAAIIVDLAAPDTAVPDAAAPPDLTPDLTPPLTSPDLAPSVACTVNPCAVEVAVGGDSSCARLTDGTLRCWGDNRSGQLATGITGPTSVTPVMQVSPLAVAGLDEPAGVGLSGTADSAAFGCAISGASRQVECWGEDNYGQLGRGGPTVNLVLPQAPVGPFVVNPAPVVGLTGVDELAVGGAHACARIGAGVQCWGATNGAAGPLGADGTGAPIFYQPTPFAVSLPRPVRQIAAGIGGGQDALGNVTCALFDDSSVGCWGDNSSGQLGQNPNGNDFGFHLVPIPAALQVSVGYQHACALLVGGEVWCWGSTYNSARGAVPLDAGEPVLEGTPTPVPLPGVATQVVAGINATCALLSSGQVACWGDNSFEQGGQSAPSTLTEATLLPNLDDVVRLAGGGGRHVCALQRSGAVVCWGSGTSGALATSNPSSSATPVTIHF